MYRIDDLRTRYGRIESIGAIPDALLRVGAALHDSPCHPAGQKLQQNPHDELMVRSPSPLQSRQTDRAAIDPVNSWLGSKVGTRVSTCSFTSNSAKITVLLK
jgi:hypothetical protein